MFYSQTFRVVPALDKELLFGNIAFSVHKREVKQGSSCLGGKVFLLFEKLGHKEACGCGRCLHKNPMKEFFFKR